MPQHSLNGGYTTYRFKSSTRSIPVLSGGVNPTAEQIINRTIEFTGTGYTALFPTSEELNRIKAPDFFRVTVYNGFSSGVMQFTINAGGNKRLTYNGNVGNIPNGTARTFFFFRGETSCYNILPYI